MWLLVAPVRRLDVKEAVRSVGERETDTASGLRFDKYLRLGGKRRSDSNEGRFQTRGPSAFDLHAVLIQLKMGHLFNTGCSWQLKANPTLRYHQSVVSASTHLSSFPQILSFSLQRRDLPVCFQLLSLL